MISFVVYTLNGWLLFLVCVYLSPFRLHIGAAIIYRLRCSYRNYIDVQCLHTQRERERRLVYYYYRLARHRTSPVVRSDWMMCSFSSIFLLLLCFVCVSCCLFVCLFPLLLTMAHCKLLCAAKYFCCFFIPRDAVVLLCVSLFWALLFSSCLQLMMGKSQRRCTVQHPTHPFGSSSKLYYHYFLFLRSLLLFLLLFLFDSSFWCVVIPREKSKAEKKQKIYNVYTSYVIAFFRIFSSLYYVSL